MEIENPFFGTYSSGYCSGITPDSLFIQPKGRNQMLRESKGEGRNHSI